MRIKNKMKKIFTFLMLTVWLFAIENTSVSPEGKDKLFSVLLIIILLLIGYIAISKFNLLGTHKKKDQENIESEDTDPEEESLQEPSLQAIEAYKIDMGDIEILNQPFQLSGLLHILTNKISDSLQENNHRVYYDIKSDIGRYLIGDTDYIGQVLAILVKESCALSTNSEIILNVSKGTNNILVFNIENQKGVMDKKLYKAYLNTQETNENMDERLHDFLKAKKIVEAMKGELTLKSSRTSGITYTFTIPFYEDKENKSHQNTIKEALEGKRALFIGKNKYDTKRSQYIFETYGIQIENMKLSEFESKRPDISRYDMAILRSEDLTSKHISFFKNIYKEKFSQFKIIIVHELFESKKKIELSRAIAHAELYNPAVIGDVEEILYQIFILKSRAVETINNMGMFDIKTFMVKESRILHKRGFRKFEGSHIAIVEDSKIDQKVIEHILMIDGITIHKVSNGEEMLELLETEEIDLIFTDINMPVMDGLSMTRKIRMKEQWQKIPIVSVSSMSFDHEIKEMYVSGMNACIPKPYKEGHFYTALERFLVVKDAKIQQKEEKAYLHHKNILDTKEALKQVKDELFYSQILSETMEALEGSVEKMDKIIYYENVVELKKFAVSTLSLYENIHAPAMCEMFRELIEFLSNKQQAYLKDYARLYQKNWKKLKIEVDTYIEYVESRS